MVIKKKAHIQLNFINPKKLRFSLISGFSFWTLYSKTETWLMKLSLFRSCQFEHLNSWVEIMIKKTDPHAFERCKRENKDFSYFRIFSLSLISKYENSEITEILQKHHNTVIWEFSIINTWNTVQMASNSKWFCYIANHVAGICLSRSSFFRGALPITNKTFY